MYEAEPDDLKCFCLFGDETGVVEKRLRVNPLSLSVFGLFTIGSPVGLPYNSSGIQMTPSS